MKLKLDPKANKNCKQCLGTGEKMTMSLFSLPSLKHYPCDCLKEGE